MTDEIWKRNEIESPCIKICVIHPESRLCTGCLRSIDEIGAWSRMTPADAFTKRRGGRAARLARKP